MLLSLAPEENRELFEVWLSRWKPEVSQGLWGSAQVRKSWEDPGSICVGWLEEAEVVSLVLYRSFAGIMEVDFLATLPGFQRAGSMGKLLGAVFAQSSDVEMWLEAHRDNVKAKKFYRKLGFQKVGVRSAYYEDGGDAELFLLKKSN